jgi:hypothetical protein
MLIKRNLGVIDRIARLAIGAICIYYGFLDIEPIGSQLIATFVGLFGVINIFAASTSHCPIYAACGINTYKGQHTPNDAKN